MSPPRGPLTPNSLAWWTRLSPRQIRRKAPAEAYVSPPAETPPRRSSLGYSPDSDVSKHSPLGLAFNLGRKESLSLFKKSPSSPPDLDALYERAGAGDGAAALEWATSTASDDRGARAPEVRAAALAFQASFKSLEERRAAAAAAPAGGGALADACADFKREISEDPRDVAKHRSAALGLFASFKSLEERRAGGPADPDAGSPTYEL